ncbi:MAG TPA: hypothetical protein VFT29_05070 [Gemmatimonadaceae bacterium]|nr:hypothetical protein [Gemmatimonadaceae bacterium]
MDLYPIALYLHFLAVVAAVSAATILQFNTSRLRRASTVGQAREAAGTIARVAPVMPIIALALFATGAYLVSLRWGWRHGWVSAGIAGLLSMPLVTLILLKPRLMALGKSLGAAKDGPIDDAQSAAINSGVIRGVMTYNHLMALAIMLVMVVKPETLGASFGVLLVAPALALVAGMTTKRPAKSVRPAVSEQA